MLLLAGLVAMLPAPHADARTSPAGTPARPAIDAACGSTVEVRADGTVWAWGDNATGQLGADPGALAWSRTPRQVSLAGGGALDGVTEVAAGCGFMLARRSDGTVWTWGANDHGQLGIGNTVVSSCGSTPCSWGARQVLTSAGQALDGVRAIGSGAEHAGAVRSDGSLWMWGSNGDGRLGTGSASGPDTGGVCGASQCSWYALQVVDASDPSSFLRSVVAVAPASDQTVALLADGSVMAWGSNAGGRTGQGATAGEQLSPAPVLTSASGNPPLSDVTRIAGGGEHVVARRVDGTMVAWGRNDLGQTGSGVTAAAQAVAAPVVTTAGGSTAFTNVKDVAAGATHSVALLADGSVWAWGDGTWGELGSGSQSSSLVPVQVVDGSAVPLSMVRDVAAGEHHSSAVRADGTTWSWGLDSVGQLGRASAPATCTAGAATEPCAPSTAEAQMPAGTGFIAVSANSWTSYALRVDGTVWAWGDNVDGELGIGNEDGSTSTPQQVTVASSTPLANIIAISAGPRNGFALRADGTVWGWGDGGQGQLGYGSSSDSNRAVQVRIDNAPTHLANITSIAGSDRATAALRSDGTVWTWGRGDYGTLGNGGISDTNLAAPALTAAASPLDRVVEVYGSQGEGDVLAVVRGDGALWMWGINDSGELATGATSGPDTCDDSEPCSRYAMPIMHDDLSTPVTGVLSVAMGRSHVVAATADGAAWSWGTNWQAQLGNGTTSSAVPYVRRVGADDSYTTFVSDVAAIAAGGGHGHALGAEGGVLSWGHNLVGQMGDGSPTSPRRYAVAARNSTNTDVLADVAALAGGRDHTVMLDGSGVVWSWGSDEYGQLGRCTSTYTFSRLPVQLQTSCGNRAPNLPRSMIQLDSNNVEILPGALTTDGVTTNLRFRFRVSDPDGQRVTPYIEIRGQDEQFSSACGGAGTYAGSQTSSIPVGTDTNISIYVTGLTQGRQYRWRACAIDESGVASPWVEYGSYPDFTIEGEAPPPASPSGTKSVATGCDFTVQLRADGTVWSVGDSAYGQLGNGYLFGTSATPVQVLLSDGTTPLSGAVRVAAGCHHALAVLHDGSVYAWGRADSGQLGAAGSTTCSAISCSPYAIRADATNLIGIRDVAAGDAFSLAIGHDGRVWGWGANGSGQLGRGSTGGTSPTAQQVVGSGGVGVLQDIKHLAAGGTFGLALSASGQVWGWGSNADQQLGFNGTAGSTYDTPRQVLVAAATPLDGVMRISASASHSLALRSNGTIMAWGDNAWRQLGTGTTADGAYAAAVRDGGGTVVTGFKDIAAGGRHSTALRSDGTVWSWGDASVGQLGINSYAGSACSSTCMSAPEQLRDSSGTPVTASTHGFKQVAAGREHTAGLTADGLVWTWGRNDERQLGLSIATTCSDSAQCSPYPRQSGFPSGAGYVSIAAGSDFSLALRADGTVWGWGTNTDGALGIGTSDGSTFRPQQAKSGSATPLTNIVAIGAADLSGFAIAADGTVWAWGEGGEYTLGNNSSSDRTYAVKVRSGSGSSNSGPLLTGITEVAGGVDHALARADDGRVYHWGDGTTGVRGDGTCCSDRPYAEIVKADAVNDMQGVIAVAAEASTGSSVAVLRDDGSVWAWGSNTQGQLGTGSIGSVLCYGDTPCETYPTPTVQDASLTPLSNAVSLAVSGHAMTAVKADGTAWAWGDGGDGQIGNDSSSDRLHAVQVLNGSATALPAATASGGGEYFHQAVDAYGQLWSWGYNRYGQLGDMSTSRRYRAVNSVRTSTVMLTSVTMSHGGEDHAIALLANGTIWSSGGNWSGQLGNCTTSDTMYFVQLRDDCPGNRAPTVFSVTTYRDNQSTELEDGQWTPDGVTNNVWAYFRASDPDDAQTLTPYIEFAPLSEPFEATCGDSSHPNVRVGTPTVLAAGQKMVVWFDYTGLSAGTQYHWRACVVDDSGAVSAWGYDVSLGDPDFGVDNILPTVPSTVHDGPVAGLDVDSTDSKVQLWASWPAGWDSGGSGIASYEYCLTTTADGSDCAGSPVIGWISNGTSRSISLSGLSLVHGTTYHVCVRMVDVAGNVSAALTCSDGQAVDFHVAGMTPSTVAQGRTGYVMQVTGTGFRSSDVVTFPGSADITITNTTYVSATRIDVTIDVSGSATLSARDVRVAHTGDDVSTATAAGALTITTPSISIELSTLGHGDAARTTSGPYGVSFGSMLPATTRTIGPADSGQATPGSAIDVTVHSDTDYSVSLLSTDLGDGSNTMPASTFEWKHHAVAEAWTAMSTTAATVEGGGSPLAATPAGGDTFSYDVRTSIPAGQAAGTYAATTTYTAAAAP